MFTYHNGNLVFDFVAFNHFLVVLFSIGLKDHLHAPNVHFYNLGLWGSDVTNGSRHKTWTLRKLSSIRSQLGHNKVSIIAVMTASSHSKS